MAKREKRGSGRKRGMPRGDGQSSPPQAHEPQPFPPEAPPQAHPGTSRIFTQCPICKTAYRITLAQLRQGRGEAYCLECQASFNALSALADTAERAGSSPPPSNQVPRLGKLEAAGSPPGPIGEREKPSLAAPAGKVSETEPLPAGGKKTANRATARLAWGIGTATLLGLLALQIGWFAWPELAQNERLRPWLDTACASLGCRLPLFRAPRRIQIISHDLHPAPEGVEGYEFTLTLANQASLPQAFPIIRLSLEDFSGGTAAVREFQPEEYLPQSSPSLMQVGELREIRLLLAKPNKEIGGFSFELF